MPKSLLKYGVDAYNVELAAQVFTPEEARAEYARLRRTANIRLAYLKKSEYSGYDIARRPQFQAGAEMSERELYRNLQTVARFVESKTSTVKGIRSTIKKEVRTLQKRGYSFVNKNNINQFREFWAEIKAHNDASMYSSEQVVELFRIAQQKKVDPETIGKDFEYWMEHSKQLSEAKPYQGSAGAVDAKHFRQLVEKRGGKKKK